MAGVYTLIVLSCIANTLVGIACCTRLGSLVRENSFHLIVKGALAYAARHFGAILVEHVSTFGKRDF